MAKQSSIEGLKKLIDRLGSNDKGGLDNATEAKIEKLISELQVEVGEVLPPIGPPLVPVPPTLPIAPVLCDPIQRISDGFLHFLTNKYYKDPDYYNALKHGQWPKFLVFACSDSRVSPSHILNFQPGEAFMARNIANLVPAFDQLRYSGVGAIIEYAVTALNVPNIMVIGHSKCGGIARLMNHPEDNSPPFDFIDEWVKIGLPAKLKVKSEFPHLSPEDQAQKCEVEAVNFSLTNLLSYPYVRAKIAEGKLGLWGGYYDFMNGSFKLWQFNSHMEHPITIPPPGPSPRVS